MSATAVKHRFRWVASSTERGMSMHSFEPRPLHAPKLNRKICYYRRNKERFLMCAVTTNLVVELNTFGADEMQTVQVNK